MPQTPVCGYERALLRALRVLRGSKPLSAFTVVKFPVVIAPIAILAGLLLPVLARAKAKGQSVARLNNVRQLSLGWFLFA
jgi:hypothetical protein